ncbi:MAG: hypothetical protein JSV86_20130 [Gemmatimonadota bacterium]|nr:MAG: hypothetical protein JSV86_20130 [Gemmatimonadota bacterium]
MNDEQVVAIIAAILAAGRLAWATGQTRPQPERLIAEEVADALDLYNEAKKIVVEKGN